MERVALFTARALVQARVPQFWIFFSKTNIVALKFQKLDMHRRGNKWSLVILKFVLPQAALGPPGGSISDWEVAWGYQVYSRPRNKKKNKASNCRPFVHQGTPFWLFVRDGHSPESWGNGNRGMTHLSENVWDLACSVRSAWIVDLERRTSLSICGQCRP